ncbi:MAG TPA: efflux RND transporter periplasmic adaptor subunit [Terracidiphilus sp.]|jgi:multidrug efflux system membrane fusion protein
MSFEDASETNLASSGIQQQPSAPRGSWVRIVVYLVLATAVGLAAWYFYQNQQTTKKQNASQAAALQNRPVPVQVAATEQKPMPIFLTALGTVTPYMSVTVKARVNGQLEPVKFTEGQQVKQGQTILIIDPRPYQAALDQAKGTLAHDEALLKNAQAEFARYKALYAAGVVSKEVMQTDEAAQGQYEGAIEADKAAVETAQLQLEWCTIKSPINGKIGLRLVDPGNIITANTTNLVIINQLQPIAVYFTLPENQLPQVLRKLMAEKRLAVDAYDQDDLQKLASGYLLTTDNQIDTTTGTGKLKAVFDNKDQALFPNQFVNIHLVMEERTNALVVPSAAIQTGTQGSYVWVVDHADAQGNGTAKIQPVKVALAEGQVTILDDGLQPGQNVVVDGADRLKAGQSVTTSQARQRSGQGAKAQGAGPSGGNPLAAPSAASGSGTPSGAGQNQSNKRDKQ